ncbi:high-potential iron-sulfur protein [Pararobbsia silviterrae]|uniref:High-potential iron-sulfur protein n=1 Tax=Pararobbsia silviterrae TaxID=1792498 RepID=A0A494Y760_9BURK|nr:high-potential iron-sulfur protein [Pararobbsia silviterrae]RKP58542.1 High potential iron-sulfur protein [Pararobbsia silviterrae]
MKHARRSFLLHSAGVLSALALSGTASAADPVAESDPTAQALGYKADGSKVDKTKFARYTPDQKCGNCALYQGAAGSASGPCPMFGGKLVSANGWCNAYSKKA